MSDCQHHASIQIEGALNRCEGICGRYYIEVPVGSMYVKSVWIEDVLQQEEQIDTLQKENAKLKVQLVEAVGENINLAHRKKDKVIEAAKELRKVVGYTTMPYIPALEEQLTKVHEALVELEQGGEG